jgi:hypothetical protein
MKEEIAVVGIVLFSIILGMLIMTMGILATLPDCPQEDSCQADYRDGAWHIEEVNP